MSSEPAFPDPIDPAIRLHVVGVFLVNLTSALRGEKPTEGDECDHRIAQDVADGLGPELRRHLHELELLSPKPKD